MWNRKRYKKPVWRDDTVKQGFWKTFLLQRCVRFIDRKFSKNGPADSASQNFGKSFGKLNSKKIVWIEL